MANGFEVSMNIFYSEAEKIFNLTKAGITLKIAS